MIFSSRSNVARCDTARGRSQRRRPLFHASFSATRATNERRMPEFLDGRAKTQLVYDPRSEVTRSCGYQCEFSRIRTDFVRSRGRRVGSSPRECAGGEKDIRRTRRRSASWDPRASPIAAVNNGSARELHLYPDVAWRTAARCCVSSSRRRSFFFSTLSLSARSWTQRNVSSHNTRSTRRLSRKFYIYLLLYTRFNM